MNDWDLLQQYANGRSEAAFAELVRRHLDWVHSVALRHVQDSQLAEDVTQSVFALLAHKAGRLRSGTILGGWLFRTTCYVGSRARRGEQSRRNREQAASSMSAETSLPPSEESDAFWERLAPHLDDAVAHLSETDRTAVLLRFYLRKPFHEIGQQLGLSEDASKKRVTRAVEKLRDFLAKHRLSIGAAALTTVLTQKTVQAVPATLAAKVVQTAGAGLAASAVLPRLAQETIGAWRWANVRLAALVAGGSAALIALMLVSNTSPHSEPSARTGATPETSVSLVRGDNEAFVPTMNGSKTKATGTLRGVLTGVVLDAQGNPVAGAKVWGGFEQKPFAETTSDLSGQFALDQAANPAFVTVTADGFATDQQEFDVANPGRPLTFRLRPVSPLRVRLVDELGEGVPGARLFLASWWGKSGTLAQNLSFRTDDAGRLQWLSPPTGELELQFGQTGYRWSRANKLFADGQEHVITLRPVATVSGSVTDEETGEPIPRFTFTLGHSQLWSPNNPIPMWDLRGQAGSNGFYSTVIEEEQTPYLQVEAVGYATVQAEIQLKDAREFVRDFPLRRIGVTNLIRGLVLGSDGQPAAGVEVALCTDQVGVMLSGTGFAARAFGKTRDLPEADYRRKTDEQGFFWFEAKPGAHTVAAVGPGGYAQARCFDWAAPLQLRLQAWAKIHGTIRTRESNRAGRTVRWTRHGNLTSWMTVFYDQKGFATTSDGTGQFTLDHVPPGLGRVALDDESEAGHAPILSAAVQLNPGETAEVQVGGVGRAVIGKFIAPAGLEIRNWAHQVTVAQLHFKWSNYNLPRELKGQAIERWKLDFEDTATGQAWFRDQYAYDFKVREDGSFIIPEALPGTYRLFVQVAQGYLGSGPNSTPSRPGDPTIASTGREVVVPAATSLDSAPLDLGEIVLVSNLPKNGLR
jgi:RNA polymerase sigma factor (sigma-70 family)